MYRIVGREGVADLRTERWHECMDALRQKWAARDAEIKRKLKERWEAAKRDYDAVGGTPFNGTKAIAKRHKRHNIYKSSTPQAIRRPQGETMLCF